MDGNKEVDYQLTSQQALLLSCGVMSFRRIYQSMFSDDENKLIDNNDLHTYFDIDFPIPENYAQELTNIVSKYNDEIRDFALKIVQENV